MLKNINIRGLSKDDVTPEDIFRMQKQGSKERCIIAKYCIKDVVLCAELCHKLTVMVNNTGMSNVCCVPFLWIFTRGQTAKHIQYHKLVDQLDILYQHYINQKKVHLQVLLY